MPSYAVLARLSASCSPRGGRFLRVTQPSATAPEGAVRLACFTHAASVCPEPGSNSPSIAPRPQGTEIDGFVLPLSFTLRLLRSRPPDKNAPRPQPRSLPTGGRARDRIRDPLPCCQGAPRLSSGEGRRAQRGGYLRRLVAVPPVRRPTAGRRAWGRQGIVYGLHAPVSMVRALEPR